MDFSAFSRMQEDIKAAMRAKQKEELTTLRSLHAEFKNARVNAGTELSEALFVEVFSRGVKRRRDAAELGASSKRDMGQVMGVLMPRMKGRTDGKLANRLVGEAQR